MLKEKRYSVGRWAMRSYCSRRCAGEARLGKTFPPTQGPIAPKKCEQCGALFERPSTCSVRAWPARKYCSRPCASAARLGCEPPNRGLPGTPWTDERHTAVKAAAKERVHSIEVSVWRGSIWQRVRGTVLDRDDHTCQHCGLHDAEIMTVDHIIPRRVRPELMYALTNCESLCPNCHARKTLRDRRTYATPVRAL